MDIIELAFENSHLLEPIRRIGPTGRHNARRVSQEYPPTIVLFEYLSVVLANGKDCIGPSGLSFEIIKWEPGNIVRCLGPKVGTTLLSFILLSNWRATV